MHSRFILRCAALVGALAAQWPAHAQNPLDQINPIINERTLPQQPQAVEGDDASVKRGPAAGETIGGDGNIHPLAIVIDGLSAFSGEEFSQVISEYSGKNLTRDDLSRLAGDVAQVARGQGYPLASASIGAQTLENGVLHVSLDEGRIDAVRVVGAISPAADHILTRRLANGKPVRAKELERAILLVEDLPGITVRQSQFMRSEGFGILLVTIEKDKASAYLQFDNRGNREVGPIRSTFIGNVRSVAASGDELTLIAAQTPLQPREFNFARLRYIAPVDSNGSTVGLFGSFGQAKPGAALSRLNVLSKSYDFGISYGRNLIRSRENVLALNLSLRRLRSEQDIAGFDIRSERLTLLDASLAGATGVAGGVLRGEVRATAGLPLLGVSKRGGPLLSRVDGDARFVTLAYDLEWSRNLGAGFTFDLASTGQVASRPLLATAEIGAGGPSFARAYDYAERSGDQGILGSAEIRYDLGKAVFGLVDRAETYASLDGGRVSNLRGGSGGGSLLSSAAGVRIGKGRASLAAEIAFPLNRDRFDTGNRAPRVSVRLARSF